MKSAFIGLLVTALIGLVGCEQYQSGGPGATSQESRRVVGQPEETFSLDMPNLSTKLHQGETKPVTIGIKRGKNFDEEVVLRFVDLPKGVTIEPAQPVLKHGEKEAKVNITAANDAALGDFTVHVTGHPSKGADASNELKIKIVKP